jgi:hypothetical protein
MAISPIALFSAFADDLEVSGYSDEGHLARCVASLCSDDGLLVNDAARAFIERECCIDSSDVTVTSAAIRAQIKALFWKYLSTTETRPELDSVAVEKFKIVNMRLDSWQYSPNTSGDEELLGSFRDLMWNFWNSQGFPLVANLHRVLDAGKVGPGVAVGARGEDFYTKMFSSPLTYTSEILLQVYLDWCKEEPTWDAAESTRCRTFGDPLRTNGSSLKFVPKDVRESRTIAVEPSLNMYYQLGLGSILTDRIKSFFGLDLRTQQFWNREAARVGSLLALLPDRENVTLTDVGSVVPTEWLDKDHQSDASYKGRNTGPEISSELKTRLGVLDYLPHQRWRPGLATIDLSSASDTIGMKMLKWALPMDLWFLLKNLRSPKSSLPGGSSIELNMVSTMGNGFTFPLETLIFSGVVVAAIKSFGITPVRPCDEQGNLRNPSGTPGEWGVFGDDIVCHPEVTNRVRRLLSLLGFVVNSNKTFVEGPFRESCGCDFYKGHDIRGFYVKEPLATRTSLYKCLNGLLEWSTRIKGVFLLNTGRLLLSHLREMERGANPLLVPLAEGRDSGLRVPVSVLQDILSRGGNYQVTMDPRCQSMRYARLVPSPKQLRVGDGYVSVPRRVRTRIYNPQGLLTAFLNGTVRNGRISIRQSDIRYRKRGCITPNWDYIPPVHDWVRLVGSRVDMRRLEIASRSMAALLLE